MINGLIIKGIGGFYYVKTDDAVYECKARGTFRNQNISPLVGDRVQITVSHNAENTIDVIEQRKNFLVRPPLANLDTIFIVSSVVDPTVNLYNIDKLTAIAEYKNIEPVIIFTKSDLSDDIQKYADIYINAGFKTIISSMDDNKSAAEVKNMLKGKISAFIGNTGVGKSTLLNMIEPLFGIATGQTSKKLGRGKHTTRHCELYETGGGYIADTPGFSSLDFERCVHIMKEDLFSCFREFDRYEGECRFTSCAHIADKGCAVCKAVEQNKIEKSRHMSYCRMYEEIKDIKEWNLK